MNDSRTRTVLLAALLTVTGLVIYKAAGFHESDAHAHATDHEVIVLDGEFSHEHQAELERHFQELQIELEGLSGEIEIDAEALRREAEELARELEHNIRIRVDRDLDREPNRRHRIHIERAIGALHQVSEDGERVVHETFAVRDGGSLVVKAPGADVRIVTGNRDEAEIEIFLEGRNMDRARAFFDELNFQVHGSEDEVVVEAETDRNWSWGNWRSRGGARISIVAHVPNQFNADVSTSGGDIHMTDLEGRATLKTSGGDIQLGRIQGAETILKTSGGDIEIDHAESDEIVMHTSGGTITGEVAEGDDIDIRTSGGRIRFESLHGESTVHTSGGRIAITEVHGDLDASTSGGSIEVGLVDADDVSLRTSGGSITILAPRDLNADIELKGSSVRLDELYPFQGNLKKNKIEGEINGGGARIHAQTSGGRVTLKAVM